MYQYTVFLGIKSLYKLLSQFFSYKILNGLRQIKMYLPGITRKMMMPLSIIGNERKGTKIHSSLGPNKPEGS